MAEQTGSPVSVEVGASAKLAIDVHTEIPKESSGRLLDAVTDLFRPISERRGLRGDQLRLQRMDVLIEIAKRARTIAELEGKALEPIPNKILVPLLERSSIEALDDDFLIDRWSALLASAGTTGTVQPRHISLLSELTSVQARILEDIFFGKIDRPKEDLSSNDDGLRVEIGEREMALAFERARSPQCTEETIFKTLRDKLRGRGLYLHNCFLTTEKHGGPEIQRNSASPMIKELSILESLDLIKAHTFSDQKWGREFYFRYYQITDLGVQLMVVVNGQARLLMERIEQSWQRAKDDGNDWGV